MFEPRVLRETGRARAQVAAALLFLVLGLAMFGVDREVGDYGPILAGVGAIAAAAALTLMSRRGVEVSSKGVTLRYVIRRRSLRWDEVLSFSIGTARPGGRERQDRPVARLVSGEVLILPGADPMWFPSQAPHAVLHELETLRVRATVP